MMRTSKERKIERWYAAYERGERPADVAADAWGVLCQAFAEVQRASHEDFEHQVRAGLLERLPDGSYRSLGSWTMAKAVAGAQRALYERLRQLADEDNGDEDDE